MASKKCNAINIVNKKVKETVSSQSERINKTYPITNPIGTFLKHCYGTLNT